MARMLYGLHRWIGLAIGLQLLAWTTGGLIFSTHTLDWVRGERTRARKSSTLPVNAIQISPAEAARTAGLDRPGEMVLREFLGEPVYEIRGDPEQVALVSATTGRRVPPLDEALATRIAREDQRGTPPARSAVLFTGSPPSEYREKPLPAWRVELDDGEETHIWVDATTGAVTARRNQAWRRYDFFWMLHTMDYAGRDRFNHPLLVGAAGIGLLSVLSGWGLWGWRLARRLSRRSARAAQDAARPAPEKP